MAVRSLLALAAASAFAAAAWWGWQRLPDRHNPWAPLAFDEPPGWLTRFKLQRLEGAACMKLLASTPLEFTPLPDAAAPQGCTFRDAVRVRRTALRLDGTLTLSCRTAVSLALWERHVVQPAALRELGRPVQRLEQLGTLACRNVYGRAEGRRSQHASAEAIDVAGLVLADGRRVSVLRHWRADGAEARFLHAIHAGACVYFDGVLGPDYNAAHADHLHLDTGPFRLCR